jgi:AcrR family transcriptional regulator
MTISKRQLEERALRKERILAGALDVFKKKGIEGATMDEIAAGSGFGKATLYIIFIRRKRFFLLYL